MIVLPEWLVERDALLTGVVFEEDDARRARWRIRNDAGEDVPAVLVGRARVERLRELANLTLQLRDERYRWRHSIAANTSTLTLWEAWNAAAAALLPTDTDPLTEE